MRRALVALVVILLGAAALLYAASETCYFQRDQIDQQNKICVYRCPSGQAAITIKNFQVCPLSIQR